MKVRTGIRSGRLEFHGCDGCSAKIDEIERLKAQRDAAETTRDEVLRNYASTPSEMALAFEVSRDDRAGCEAEILRTKEELTVASDEIERLKKHETETRECIRSACDEIGDLDWDDSLHLGDVVEKHLARPASYEIRTLRSRLESAVELVSHEQAIIRRSIESQAQPDSERPWVTSILSKLAKLRGENL